MLLAHELTMTTKKMNGLSQMNRLCRHCCDVYSAIYAKNRAGTNKIIRWQIYSCCASIDHVLSY